MNEVTLCKADFICILSARNILFCHKVDIFFFLLYLLTHRRKLVIFLLGGMWNSEEASAEQSYKQWLSQPWWTWMSVGGKKCLGMAGKGRVWLLGKTGYLTIWCWSGCMLQGENSKLLNSIKLLCLAVCVRWSAWFSLCIRVDMEDLITV